MKCYPNSAIVLRLSAMLFLCCFFFLSSSQWLAAQPCTGVNDVGGQIFYDYNLNGIQDEFEGGVAGVSVVAYGDSGTSLGTATSDANGAFAIGVPNGTAVRVEFTSLPSGVLAGITGDDSQTTVQFTESPFCGLSLGVNDPVDYCDEDAPIAVPCYGNGDPLAGGDAADIDVLVSFAYTAEGTTTMPDIAANADELGSVWGIAYHRHSKKLFSAAFLKRFVGLGTQGTGGIYMTDFSGAVPSSSNFINLQSLGVNTGSIGVRDLPADINTPSRDVEAFSSVGKIGLGDIDISSDGNTLWVINLAGGSLVTIDLTNYNNTGVLPTAANVSETAIPNPACANSDYRPFALKYHKGKLYVGGVCTAEISGNASDLSASVYEYDPSLGSFTSTVSFSLDYVKGALTSFGFGNNCDRWETWSDDYTDFYHTNLPNGICYPQPMLSDIEFDTNGAMVLGFMDRSGHQLGRENLSPVDGDMNLGTGAAGGDIIRVANNSGVYVVESNGIADATGCGSGSGNGIGGGEFYCGDQAAGGEEEGSMGSLALMPGSGEVVMTALNPFVTNSGGLAWLSNQDGNSNRKFQLYEDDPAYLGKAHGLGDLELLCDLPPVEIGNYVWLDANGNGVQDPGESGIEGMEIELYDGTGNFLASTITDNNGEYVFNEDNVLGGLQAETPYFLTLDPILVNSNGTVSVGTNTYGSVTTPNDGVGSIPDQNDSDALDDASSGLAVIDVNDLPYISFTTGEAGESNHNLDFGFTVAEVTPCPDILTQISLFDSEICSGSSASITVTHTPIVGNLAFYYNIGSIITGTELYEADHGGASIIDEVVSPSGLSTTTTISFFFPENNTNGPFPYNVYAILAEGNANIDAPNCLPVVSTNVVINPTPTANVSADQTICAGESATMTATGGNTYAWSNGQNTASITVVPATTTTYTVTVTNEFACTDTEEVIVTVGNPQADAGIDQNICDGQAATLTATGGIFYAWNTGVMTPSIVVNPLTTTIYTVTVTDANGCTDTDDVTVVVGSTVANAGPNQTICIGETTNLTASGGVTYSWSTGQSGASISVNPATTTTYSITVTDASGCTGEDQVTITVSNPQVTVSPNQTICMGESATMTASGGVSYAWSNGQSGSDITVVPTTTTTYTVTITDANGCTDTGTSIVNVNDPQANAGTDQSICEGGQVTLTATGGIFYAWNTGAMTPSIVVNPLTTTTYTVTITDANGCIDTDDVTVFVGSAVANAGLDQGICVGETTNLTASGGISYIWSSGQGGASISVNPATTTTYSVTVMDASGCTGEDQVTVTVSNPQVTISPSQTICLGESATMTASGGVSYAWSNGQSGTDITVVPTTTTTYTVTMTDTNGCTDTATSTVNVNDPQANAGLDQSICDGEAATLTASGGTSYQWNTGVNTATIIVNPLITTTYSVTVTDGNGCVDTDNVTVVVGSAVANLSPAQTICVGETTTLTASGGVTYAWNTGQSGTSISANPSTTTTYTVTVTDASGCTGEDQVTITVSNPQVTVSSSQTVCLGESATMTASGGVSYAWSNGQSGTNITVVPTTTTTYTVTMTDANGCTDTGTSTVTVGNIQANAGGDQSICDGENATLTASGGSIYQWNTGVNTATILVNPLATTTYMVTVTDSNGCTDTDDVTVVVGSAVANAGSDQTICIGESATLTASGGATYAWNTGQSGTSISVTPATTTTYSVTVTNADGCTGEDQVTITVSNPQVTVSVSQTICMGESATMTASGGVSYVWSNGQTGSNITVVPATTTTYTVTMTDANGCMDTGTSTITVNNPQANAGADQNICEGGQITLTATGGIFYAWNTGVMTPSIVVSPIATTTYTVTVTDSNNCTDTDEVTVFVGSATANAGEDQTICIGETANLTASGGIGYVWSSGQNGASIAVSPATTTTYSVTVTNDEGCTDTDEVMIVVSNPQVSAGADITICEGTSTTLTATGTGTTYNWSSGQSGANIAVNPTITTTYTVTMTDANNCTITDQVVVTVSDPTANAGSDVNICFGELTTLTATGGVSYIWNNMQTTVIIQVSPIVTSIYSVTVTDANGCTDVDEVSVNVSQAIANAGPDQNICIGENVTLTATGGVSYQWSTNQTGANINVAPTITTTYSVTVTDANGCTDTDEVTISVGNPQANAGPDQAICLGESVVLTATGGNTYQWSNGQNTASINVTPNTTTAYTVTITDATGCTDTDEVMVIVNSATANAGPDQTICSGECINLTATGGIDYQWNNGIGNATITVSPLTTTTYTVTVTDENGCTDTDEVIVIVNSATVAAGLDQAICVGQTVTLTATGTGGSFVWSNGATGATITVSPQVSTLYVVSVTGANGCVASDDIQVTVSGDVIADAGLDQVICAGETASFTATGGTNYQWSNGQNSPTISVSPTETTTYSVTVTNAGGCQDIDFVVVIVGHAIANAGADQAICVGESVTLNALGGGSYQWNTGASGAALVVNPVATTTYTVTVTDTNGCMDTDEVQVIVGSPIVANLVAEDEVVCVGECTTLNASGGIAYNWSTGQSGASISVTPNMNTSYTVTVTDAFGCTGVAQVVVMTTDCTDTPPAITATNDNAFSPNGAPVDINIMANDNSNGAPTIFVLAQPLHGTIVVTANGVTYTPNDNFSGSDVFTYQICDSENNCDDAMVFIQVGEEGCESVTSICTQPVTPIQICPEFCNLGLDDDIALENVSTSFNCSIEPIGDNCFQYTALPLFAGQEMITVVGCNGLGICDTAYINVEVTMDCTEGMGVVNDSNPTQQKQDLQAGWNSPLSLVSLHPVPTTDRLQVHFTTDKATVDMTLLDLMGKPLTKYRQTSTANSGLNIQMIDVANLPAGIYLVQLNDGEQVVSGKFVKQ